MHAVGLPRKQCPSCGAKLSALVSAEQCTPCLLRLAFNFDHGAALDVDGSGSETEQSGVTGNGLPAAPGLFAEYELIEPIGRGAMGVVFKARQRSLDRLVALKVLDLTGPVPADAAKRFQIEASAAAALRHPGIVTIHEVGVHQGRHYLAMDLIEGPTLATLVAQQPLAAEGAARLLASVADAVQCAHERGILHRDLKPSNILVDASDEPRVADFGLAKRMHADADMTIPGNIMGSPNYMSPEQARGAALGPASDVHALGAILYHCLSGRPPFVGQTVPDTLHHVIHSEAVALRLLVAGVPRDLDTITLKCLEKDPSKRYADARSLSEDLRRFLRREPISARPAGKAVI
jgi:eukaryotic-like serine/threonine-protein kinase